jgi:hypothetical protein
MATLPDDAAIDVQREGVFDAKRHARGLGAIK